jgi:hypothetical protein
MNLFTVLLFSQGALFKGFRMIGSSGNHGTRSFILKKSDEAAGRILAGSSSQVGCASRDVQEGGPGRHSALVGW